MQHVTLLPPSTMHLFGQYFSPLETAGALTTVLAIWLTVKENWLCFPIGIVSSLIYAFVFFDPAVRFYSDAFLQLFYVLLLVYGWIHWTSGKKKSEAIHVTVLTAQQRILLAAVTLAAALLLGFLLKTHTPASLPYLDALTTCMSLAAQWMVARKKIENWMIWIVANVIYVFMYIQKELFITAVLYFVLLILAVAGWKEWKKHLAGATS